MDAPLFPQPLHLDLRTVALLAGLMGCLMGILMQSMRKAYPPTIHGLGEWTYLPMMNFLAVVLIGLRDHIPLLISVTLGNMMIIGAILLTVEGMQRFYNQPSWRRPLLTLWLVVLIPLVLLREPAWMALRVGMISALLGLLFAVMMWQIGRQDRHSLPARFLLGVLSLLLAVMVLRSTTIWTGDLQKDLFVGSLIQTTYLSVLAFGPLLLIPLGLILLASDQLRLEIVHLATQDSLTGLLNRRALFEVADTLLLDCHRRNQPLTLLLLDLDHFKQINDTHGHLIGDRVLIEFSRRMQSVLPHPAVLGRYGGEEFIALLPGLSCSAARELSTRLLNSSAQDATLPTCTVSIGMIHVSPDTQDWPDVEDLIHQADIALYRAKDLGRHRIEEATPEAKLTP